MRPIYGYGGGNELGAWSNNANPRPLVLIDKGYFPYRIDLEPVLVPLGSDDPRNVAMNHWSGEAPVSGTFKDSSGRPSWAPLGRPIGAMRYIMPYTGPVAILLARPKVRGIEQQVTNPDVRRRQPGWTYQLPVNMSGRISQAIRSNYSTVTPA